MNDIIFKELDIQALALAVARNNVGENLPISQILAREHYTQAQYDALQNDKLFTNMVEAYELELVEKGFSFMAKNKVAAEDGIRDMYRLLKDPDTPAAVKVKIHENFVANSGLAPKQTANTAGLNGEGGAGIVINIQPPAGYTVKIGTSTADHSATMIPATQIDDVIEGELVDNADDDAGYENSTYEPLLDEGYEDTPTNHG